MSDMPLTDSCNAQFDAWDSDIEQWKKENREIARKKLEEMKKSIEEWCKSQIESLNKDQKQTENSPIMQKLKAAQGAIAAISGSPEEMVSKMKDAMTAIADFMAEVVKFVSDKIFDITEAAKTITTRGPETISKCTVPV